MRDARIDAVHNQRHAKADQDQVVGHREPLAQRAIIHPPGRQTQPQVDQPGGQHRPQFHAPNDHKADRRHGAHQGDHRAQPRVLPVCDHQVLPRVGEAQHQQQDQEKAQHPKLQHGAVVNQQRRQRPRSSRHQVLRERLQDHKQARNQQQVLGGKVIAYARLQPPGQAVFQVQHACGDHRQKDQSAVRTPAQLPEPGGDEQREQARKKSQTRFDKKPGKRQHQHQRGDQAAFQQHRNRQHAQRPPQDAVRIVLADVPDLRDQHDRRAVEQAAEKEPADRRRTLACPQAEPAAQIGQQHQQHQTAGAQAARDLLPVGTDQGDQ